jgi:glycosyltransferase involved in cell wall biosynthesis
MTLKSPSSLLPLSIFIITRDEADRIGRTLDALAGLSDDIIVVDSGSVDGTRDIAAAKGARVVEHAFEGYGPQKRFAETVCRHPWLLNLDADEVLPADLAAEIRALFGSGELTADAYRIRIAEIFPGEGAPHRFAYALSPVRLYRRDKGTYSASPVHDRVDLAADARIGRLRVRQVRRAPHQADWHCIHAHTLHARTHCIHDQGSPSP